MRVAVLLLLSGCASMLQPIPGMVHVATCKSGPAYHARGELICDDWSDTPFASRKLEPNDNAGSACVFCDGWRF